VKKGLSSRFDYVRDALGSEIRYDKWREYDPEDLSVSTHFACGKQA
jgi:metal-responsive CopG/Arc/MetJ family transcriptional regulator